MFCIVAAAAVDVVVAEGDGGDCGGDIFAFILVSAVVVAENMHSKIDNSGSPSARVEVELKT